MSIEVSGTKRSDYFLPPWPSGIHWIHPCWPFRIYLLLHRKMFGKDALCTLASDSPIHSTSAEAVSSSKNPSPTVCLPIKKRVLGVVSLGGSIIAVSVLGGSHTSNLNPCIWTYRWYYVYEHACLANPIGGTNSDLLQRTHTTSFFWLRKLRRYGSCKRQSSDELVQYPQRWTTSKHRNSCRVSDYKFLTRSFEKLNRLLQSVPPSWRNWQRTKTFPHANYQQSYVKG